MQFLKSIGYIFKYSKNLCLIITRIASIKLKGFFFGFKEAARTRQEQSFEKQEKKKR